MSWGGVNSLAVVYPDLIRPTQDFEGRIVRLNVGLEDVDDLIEGIYRLMMSETVSNKRPSPFRSKADPTSMG